MVYVNQLIRRSSQRLGLNRGVCLVGLPNSGKSTLYNAMIGHSLTTAKKDTDIRTGSGGDDDIYFEERKHQLDDAM